VSDVLPPRPDLVGSPPEDVRPSATWQWWEVVLFTLLAAFVGILASLPLFAILEPSSTAAVDGPGLLISAVFDLVIGGVLVLWLRSAHPWWTRILGWPTRDRLWAEIGVGIGYGVLLEVIAVAAGVFIALALEATTGRAVEAPTQVDPGIHGWEVAALVLLACVIAPTVEEFVFRGLLFRSIADRTGFWLGAIVSAVPFGLTHVAVGSSLDLWALRLTLMVVGVGLAWVHWRRRNLLANIVAHSTFNVIGVAIILAGGRG
jgi:membrane protease YdiL (CAAX protease family)